MNGRASTLHKKEEAYMPDKTYVTKSDLRAWVAKQNSDIDAYEEHAGGDHECDLQMSAQRELLEKLEDIIAGKHGPKDSKFLVPVKFTVYAETAEAAQNRVNGLWKILKQQKTIPSEWAKLLDAVEGVEV